MERHIAFILLAALWHAATASAQSDTLRLSSNYTTHILFSTDLSYVDISDPSLVAAGIVEKNSNVLAIKARAPFDTPTSVTAMESDRSIHPFIVIYDPNPRDLVVDLSHRNPPAASTQTTQATAPTARPPQGQRPGQQLSGTSSMKDLYRARRTLYHICTIKNGITISCENILTHSDVLYLVLSLENSTSTDYLTDGATFSVESRRKSRRSVLDGSPVFPRNRYGNLSCQAGKTGREVYSFDKMTLDRGQVLRVYFYEADDQRNLVLEIDWKDINRAQKH